MNDLNAESLGTMIDEHKVKGPTIVAEQGDFFGVLFNTRKVYTPEEVTTLVHQINEKICALCTSIAEVAWMEESIFKGQSRWVTKSKKTIQDISTNKAILYKLDPDKPAKLKGIFDLWWAHIDRKTADGLVFNPKETPYFSKNNRLNDWSGFAIEPTFGDNHAPILDFTLMNICDNRTDVYEYMINYLAHIIQKPWIKPRVCISLCSTAEGTGKGTLIESVMGRILGRHTITLKDSSELLDRFNYHLRSALLVYHDESLFAGNKGLSSALKSKIVGYTMGFERKGRDKSDSEKIFHRHFISTNNVHSTMVSDTDRRYTVINPVIVPGRDSDWFHNFHESVVKNDVAISDFMGFLVNWKLDPKACERPIATVEKSEQAELSKSGPESFMDDLKHILKGDIYLQGADNFKTKTKNYTFVTSLQLRELYKQYQKENRIHAKDTLSSRGWGLILKEWAHKLAGFEYDPKKTIKGINGYDLALFIQRPD